MQPMTSKDKNDEEIHLEIHLDEKSTKNQSKSTPPRLEISTSRKHSMDYFTVDGVILRTGYADKKYWYLLPLREGMDNGIDFLWKWFRGSDNASVKIDITKDDNLFRIKMRNSNYKDIPVFEDLEAVFNFDMRYGSKQDLHIIGRGMLGDAMKQILSLGYVLIHVGDDGSAFENKQWEHPLIVRHNGKEWKIYLHVDKAAQDWKLRLESSTEKPRHIDTEIEVVLPIIDEVRHSLTREYIERFCREYSIFTTDISFKYRILDDSNPPPINHTDNEFTAESPYSTPDDNDLSACFCATDREALKVAKLVTALSTPAPKAILNIDVPAVHPIATQKEWSNADSIHSYKADEFMRRITNVHNKKIRVYDVLLEFREGSNIKNTAKKTEISVAELLSDPNSIKKMEDLYNRLNDALPLQERISLPYPTNEERKNALIARVATLYNDLDKEAKPFYRVFHGYYDDSKRQHPYAFEILAIPLTRPNLKETEFIGAVNYSVSPKSIRFEGNYDVSDKKAAYMNEAGNMDDILIKCGFHRYGAGPKSRLSCIVLGNLITPVREPHGHDKSRIVTQPFAKTIVDAVKKMALRIPTYQAAGYSFPKQGDYSSARWRKSKGKQKLEDVIREFLHKERGLPL